MEEELAYYCDGCDKVIKKTGEIEYAPECCGKEMRIMPLRECGKDPSFAEHARLDDDDQPCDPGMG